MLQESCAHSNQKVDDRGSKINLAAEPGNLEIK